MQATVTEVPGVDNFYRALTDSGEELKLAPRIVHWSGRRGQEKSILDVDMKPGQPVKIISSAPNRDGLYENYALLPWQKEPDAEPLERQVERMAEKYDIANYDSLVFWDKDPSTKNKMVIISRDRTERERAYNALDGMVEGEVVEIGDLSTDQRYIGTALVKQDSASYYSTTIDPKQAFNKADHKRIALIPIEGLISDPDGPEERIDPETVNLLADAFAFGTSDPFYEEFRKVLEFYNEKVAPSLGMIGERLLGRVEEIRSAYEQGTAVENISSKIDYIRNHEGPEYRAFEKMLNDLAGFVAGDIEIVETPEIAMKESPKTAEPKRSRPTLEELTKSYRGAVYRDPVYRDRLQYFIVVARDEQECSKIADMVFNNISAGSRKKFESHKDAENGLFGAVYASEFLLNREDAESLSDDILVETYQGEGIRSALSQVVSDTYLSDDDLPFEERVYRLDESIRSNLGDMEAPLLDEAVNILDSRLYNLASEKIDLFWESLQGLEYERLDDLLGDLQILSLVSERQAETEAKDRNLSDFTRMAEQVYRIAQDSSFLESFVLSVVDRYRIGDYEPVIADIRTLEDELVEEKPQAMKILSDMEDNVKFQMYLEEYQKRFSDELSAHMTEVETIIKRHILHPDLGADMKRYNKFRADMIQAYKQNNFPLALNYAQEAVLYETGSRSYAQDVEYLKNSFVSFAELISKEDKNSLRAPKEMVADIRSLVEDKPPLKQWLNDDFDKFYDALELIERGLSDFPGSVPGRVEALVDEIRMVKTDTRNLLRDDLDFIHSELDNLIIRLQ